MSAQIIDMFARRPAPLPVAISRGTCGTGNGAREALIDLAMSLPAADQHGSLCWADWILLELWASGFKVVPLGTDEPQ